MMQPYNIETRLGHLLYSQNTEKSFIDKVLAKNDVEKIKDLMKKEKLERTDLLELLYMLPSIEIKLVNMGEWERYLLGKFFSWIRDFVASAELLYDYLDKIDTGEIKVTEKTKKALENTQKLILHDIKFLVDVFFYLARSTLSLGATGFDTLTKSRFEYYYPEHMQKPEQEKKSHFSIFLRR